MGHLESSLPAISTKPNFHPASAAGTTLLGVCCQMAQETEDLHIATWWSFHGS